MPLIVRSEMLKLSGGSDVIWASFCVEWYSGEMGSSGSKAHCGGASASSSSGSGRKGRSKERSKVFQSACLGSSCGSRDSTSGDHVSPSIIVHSSASLIVLFLAFSILMQFSSFVHSLTYMHFQWKMFIFFSWIVEVVLMYPFRTCFHMVSS